jgi:hypothetical protein
MKLDPDMHIGLHLIFFEKRDVIRDEYHKERGLFEMLLAIDLGP